MGERRGSRVQQGKAPVCQGVPGVDVLGRVEVVAKRDESGAAIVERPEVELLVAEDLPRRLHLEFDDDLGTDLVAGGDHPKARRREHEKRGVFLQQPRGTLASSGADDPLQAQPRSRAPGVLASIRE